MDGLILSRVRRHAGSAITPYQGFKLGENVWALQFHLEAQDNTVSSFLALDDEGLPLGEYVQSEAEIFTTQHLEQCRQALYSLLEQMNSRQALSNISIACSIF